MKLKIEYGFESDFKDVTQHVLNNLLKNGNIYIINGYKLRNYLLNIPLDENSDKKVLKIEYSDKSAVFDNDTFIKFSLFDVYYGNDEYYKDITNIVLKKCLTNNHINIPKNEKTRKKLFGDPLPGKEKKLLIIYLGQQYIFDFNEDFSFNVFNLNFETPFIDYTILNEKMRLNDLHNKLNFLFGSLKDEYPEQLMSLKYIDPNDIVLEIGANVGRNTCIISTILNDSRNLLTLETVKENCDILYLNRELNGFKFKIENSALSYKQLIQKEWNTRVLQDDEEIPEDYFKVNTITFEEILEKYNLNFNVLVLDCEGAIYHILKDNPDILKNINKVIIENDFDQIEHKQFVDDVFDKYGLYPIYTSTEPVWGPCKDFFYQVFIKN